MVQWVMERVNKWRDSRDQAFNALWGEYYRLWRGRFIDADKTRASQRSRLVSPALAQALEMTVAELEEATFGREAWVDVEDDAGDVDHTDIDGNRQMFLEDMKADKIPGVVSGSYLNGGIWGTLAAKVVVEKREIASLQKDEDGSVNIVQTPTVHVKGVSIPPMNLIPDPESDCDDQESALGIAHEVKKPRAWLLKNTWSRSYGAMASTRRSNQADFRPEFGDKEDQTVVDPNNVLVTEWHGKVPKKFLDAIRTPVAAVVDKDDPLASAVIGAVQPEPEGVNTGLDGDGEMVEAIVTIFDKSTLGRAIENPFLLKDRSIITCQFERVPNRFWGRGVMEKGFNPQKALDAELRTRMDVMALISNPMMGADQTSLPRGFDLRVRPGKVWLTNGAPKEALHPISFPNLDPSSFSQSGEMERMVQIGTGAMDTATPIAQNGRNETATGTSLIAGTFVKRAKRALRHITENFTEPLVQKILLRRIQYDPERYSPDMKFRVSGTLGIVARELEQQNMTQLMALVEPGSNAQRTLVESIFDATSSPYKAQMAAALAEDAKPDPAQQALQQLQQQAAQIEVQKAGFEAIGVLADNKVKETTAILNLAKAQKEYHEMGIEDAKLEQTLVELQVEVAELREFSRQNDISELKVLLDAAKGEQSGNRQNTAESGATV
jgi:hypothetical protein